MGAEWLIRIVDRDRQREQRHEALPNENFLLLAANENRDLAGAFDRLVGCLVARQQRLRRIDCRRRLDRVAAHRSRFRIGAVPLRTRSGCAIVAAARIAVGCLAPSVATFIVVCGSGFDLGTNTLACANSVGVNSSRATITRTPSLVMGHSLIAKSWDMRMQPCEAGCPGSSPSCSATPDQVMRCM